MRTLPLLLLAGCAFDRSGLTSDDVVPDAEVAAIDADPAAPDADPTAPDATPSGCQTWTAQNVGDPCDAQFGEPGTLTLSSGRSRYDTDTGVLTAPGGGTSTPPSVVMAQDDAPDVRVLVLSSLTIPAGTALVGEGSLPLLAIVYGDATIAGTIDVSAITSVTGATSTPGAGGDDAVQCGDGIPLPADASTGTGGGGGGGGGGYGEDGGDGGDGHGGGHGGKAGKGKANGTATIVPLRGGCAGSAGGDDSSAIVDDAGRAGSGGGGFELTAFGAITITGTIAANGTGGGGVALVNAGGGGGGSGGAILLDGDVVTIDATAKLCANGGGGGEGGADGLTGSSDGDNATCVEAPRANGGDGTADAGNGGDGGAAATPSGTNGSPGAMEAGGGAGGGSVGRIRVHGRSVRNVDVGSIVSPDATT